MLIDITNKLINTEQRFICISRPRRFGKSIAANMLTAYYSRGCDSKELFFHYIKYHRPIALKASE
ncbi:MAG: AAA family ATPase [Oscillospiraceae bacterium]|nr:AAA family ATPase [Oscillospiraceae bacterium]